MIMRDRSSSSRAGCFKGFCSGCIFGLILVCVTAALLFFYKSEIKRYLLVKGISYIETELLEKTSDVSDREKLKSAFAELKAGIENGDIKIDLGAAGSFLEELNTSLKDKMVDEKEALRLLAILRNVDKWAESQITDIQPQGEINFEEE